MAFRRYGGDIDHSTRSGSNVNIVLYGFLLFIALLISGMIFSVPGLVILAPFILFTSLFLSMLAPGGATAGIKQKRQKHLLNKAQKLKNNGGITEAKKLAQKALVHGDIPKEYQALYKSLID